MNHGLFKEIKEKGDKFEKSKHILPWKIKEIIHSW